MAIRDSSVRINLRPQIKAALKRCAATSEVSMPVKAEQIIAFYLEQKGYLKVEGLCLPKRK